jgi:uncharacterized protein YciI
MPLYALIYRYADDPDVVARHRPQHRTYLRSLAEAGHLLVAGPLGEPGPAGGLLVFDVESAERVQEFADGDPFHARGLIAERTVQAWTLSIGADRFPTDVTAP